MSKHSELEVPIAEILRNAKRMAKNGHAILAMRYGVNTAPDHAEHVNANEWIENEIDEQIKKAHQIIWGDSASLIASGVDAEIDNAAQLKITLNKRLKKIGEILGKAMLKISDDPDVTEVAHALVSAYVEGFLNSVNDAVQRMNRELDTAEDAARSHQILNIQEALVNINNGFNRVTGHTNPGGMGL